MAAPSVYRPRGLGWVYSARDRGDRLLADIGHFLSFLYYAVRFMPHALWKYRAQTISTVTDLSWGRGAVIVGGGTSLVMVVMGAAAGATVTIAAYSTLNMMSMGSITGVVSSYAITREFAPLLAALGFAVQAGCRMTAEIGSMRISEEVDALEALGIRSISFVVSTRIMAGVITIVPTFLVTIVVSYLTGSVVVMLRGESAGAYQHYFSQFINLPDLLYGAAKVVIFIIVIIVIHCYQGYFAAGGPEGVGVASGHAIRASLVAIIVLDMLLTMLFFGFDTTLVFKG